jgi:hypothetical protein
MQMRTTISDTIDKQGFERKYNRYDKGDDKSDRDGICDRSEGRAYPDQESLER